MFERGNGFFYQSAFLNEAYSHLEGYVNKQNCSFREPISRKASQIHPVWYSFGLVTSLNNPFLRCRHRRTTRSNTSHIWLNNRLIGQKFLSYCILSHNLTPLNLGNFEKQRINQCTSDISRNAIFGWLINTVEINLKIHRYSYKYFLFSKKL